ncbi:hypothetical protein J5837_08595 [Pseudoxanthomonas helianthi]|uniref:SGNH/GDSL hydrolase family protein n=1 Tax=Pseudoxanthomonas helianthi TaxID=1453541 RepID=A0A940X3B9_9GAMM|nr:hypothetical protein [Pseudoxanthomonas helianthi]MBP3984486.1 hypothetical protein [Pseudoxanthomonas helianthi]
MLAFGLWLFAVASSGTASAAGAAERPVLRVLVVGNSLTYTNNLPGLLRALASAQENGPAISTTTYVLPGADLVWHWRNGTVAKAIDQGHWDMLVLQERGGILACLADSQHRGEPECLASSRAHRQFAELAGKKGVRVLLLGTWGPDATWQGNLDRGLRIAARSTQAKPVFAGTALRAYASSHPGQPLFTDAALHPTLPASLIVAAVLYRELAGQPAHARDLVLDFPLKPDASQLQGTSPMEPDPAFAGERKVLPAATMAPLLEAASGHPGAPN